MKQPLRTPLYRQDLVLRSGSLQPVQQPLFKATSLAKIFSLPAGTLQHAAQSEQEGGTAPQAAFELGGDARESVRYSGHSPT